MSEVILAVDLGAESGRLLAAELNEEVVLHEVHRFPNQTFYDDLGILRWDIDGLWSEIVTGLTQAAKIFGDRIISLAFDTWAVDYALIDVNDQVIEPPVCYRDTRTEGLPGEVASKHGENFFWHHTGVRDLNFNSVFQLLALQKHDPSKLVQADWFLMIPDFLAWKVSGVKSTEWTNASSTGMVKPAGQGWHLELLETLGLKGSSIFEKPLTKSGTILGNILPDLANKTGLPKTMKIIATAAHDTAAAAALTPPGEGQAFISCGTWSLMGLVVDEPILSPDAKDALLSNELHWDGRSRPLKNIMGLWVLQNSRKQFNETQENELSYSEIVALARNAEDLKLILDVDDSRFFLPHSEKNPYLERIGAWFEERGITVDPTDVGLISRAIIRGLALAYKKCQDEIEAVTGTKIQKITILGGGARNELLVEMTREMCNCAVEIGHYEATSAGNLLVQAKALQLPFNIECL
ncbi:MAG: rhamnulokinase [Lentisphaeria bacterium]|nr:rhamnulokinase [Lentisphaeria bacterium]